MAEGIGTGATIALGFIIILALVIIGLQSATLYMDRKVYVQVVPTATPTAAS